MSSTTKNREPWADYVKAIAIWLVVFCHANLNSDLLMEFIYMFHMPVFFVISGYFDKGKEFSMELVKKNFNGLIRPYFIYSILGLSICWISPYLHPELYSGITGFPNIFKAAIIGMFMMDDHISTYSFMPIGCLWFLPALFICKSIFSLSVLSWNKQKWTLLILLGFIALIIYIRPLLFSLDTAVFAIPFYVIGFFISQKNIIKICFSNKTFNLLFVSVAVFYMFLLGVKNGRVDMDGCNFGRSILWFYFNAVVGSLVCIAICRSFKDTTGILSIVGASSLMVLATHPYIIYLVKVASSLLFNADMRNFPIWGSAIIACIACLMVVGIKKSSKLKWLP